MRRLAVELSPPIDLLKVRAEAYFAITSNSLQFGGGLTITADVGIASGKAWMLVDALFKWTPHIFFTFPDRRGHRDQGHADGRNIRRRNLPRRTLRHDAVAARRPRERHALLEGHPVRSRPLGMGREGSPLPQLPISPVEGSRAGSLRRPPRGRPQLPAGTDTLARFIEDDSTPLLVHPLGQLEIKQLRVPLETAIDRIGSNPVTSRCVHLDEPKFGTLADAGCVACEGLLRARPFPESLGRRTDLASALRGIPLRHPHGRAGGVAHGPAMSVAQVWETFYPHEDFGRPGDRRGGFRANSPVLVIDNNSVSRAAREKVNPYLPPVPPPDPEPYAPREAGRVGIARRDDLSADRRRDGMDDHHRRRRANR